MQPAAQQTDDLSSILSELESLLKVECAALKRLDRNAIDEHATHKLVLFERLDALLKNTRAGVQHRAQLERVRKGVLLNQLLLVHARDVVRGTLALLTGDAPASRPLPTSARSGGMRIDVRG